MNDSDDCFATADDNEPCTFPPPRFSCPRAVTTLPADDDGVYFLLVQSGSGDQEFAGPEGEYEIQFDADPPGVTALQLVGNNEPDTF